MISDTDDSSGVVERKVIDDPPTREQLLSALFSQTGSIMQRPPAFSALKLSGRRAYQLAREGNLVELAARPATVYKIDLESYEFPSVECSIRCASGTYIRSIARDVGETLGCGGLMHSLVRTEIGPFELPDALETSSVTANNIREHLNSPACAFPGVESVMPDVQQLEMLRDGKPVSFAGQTSNRLIAKDSGGSFLALLVRLDSQDGFYKAEINLVPILYSK